MAETYTSGAWVVKPERRARSSNFKPSTHELVARVD